MKKSAGILSVLIALASPAAVATTASAQLEAGDVLVVDSDVPPVSTGVLFQVDPQTGARTVLSSFGAGNPSAVAVEADGDVLVTDTDAGTDPAGGTSEWGALYRLSADPVSGVPARTILSDFGAGASTGRTPRAVAVEADGQILVINAGGGTSNRAVLVRVDPDTGARAVVSDFGDAGQGSLGVEPRGVAVEAGGQILVIDAQAGTAGVGELVRIDPRSGMRSRVSDFGSGSDPGSNPTSLVVEADGQVLVTDEGHPSTTPLGLLFRVDPQIGLRSILSDFNTGANTGREPEGVALEQDGQILVVDKHAGPLNRGMLLRVDPITGERTVVSDFGSGTNQGGDPLALAVVPPTRGTLEVVTEVVNDNGGSLAASDVTVQVEGSDPTPATFQGQGPPGTTVTLAPGSYDTITLRLPGYGVSFSPGCGGTIAAGDTKTCTISVDDDPGRLIVVNEVLNDNGGTALPADWTIDVTGANPAPASFPGAPAPGTTVALDAGAYSVSASGPAAYDSTLSADCTGTIAVGETRTCTIATDDRSARVIVIHELINDNGGTAVLSDFTSRVFGSNPSPAASFPGQGSPGTTVTLDPGDYYVSISWPPGYGPPDFSAGCIGTIALGETRTCTMTANDLPAMLLVDYEVVNDDGGAAVAGDFTVTVSGGDPSPASFPGQDRDNTLVSLDAGGYSVDVSGPPGYSTTLSPDCAGTIRLSEAKLCTITSDDRPPAVPRCDGKLATILGAAGPTEIRGTAGDDVIVDLDGSNIVRGRGGDDAVCTGPGNDEILVGGGADTVIDSGGRNRIDSGAGRDALTTGAGDDRVLGGGGNDTVAAGDGANVVEGDGGDDRITAGAGNDRIDGGVGFDTCTPGPGANTVNRCEAIT